MALKPVTEGWTEDIIHQLLNDGTPADIQGMTVELILEKADGTSVDTSAKVTNLDDGTAGNKGKVSFAPAVTDLVTTGSPYYWKWQVTAGVNDVAFWPNDKALRLKVYPVGKKL